MKKLIAAILALLTLLSPMATGETGDRIAFTDMALAGNVGGETREADLSDVAFTLSTGRPDGVPTIQAELSGKGGRAWRAVLQYIHGVAYFNMDHLTQPLALNVATFGKRAQSFVEGLFDDAAGLMDFKPPLFEGIEIPRVAVAPMATLLGGHKKTGEDGTRTATFDMPYKRTRAMVKRLRRLADFVPEAAREALGPALAMIDAMLEGDSGFALKGTATDGGEESTLTVDVYPVQGGATADKPIATIDATFARNRVNAAVVMRQAVFSVKLADFTLTSEPEKARLECALNVIGTLNASAEIYPVDGAQYASVEARARGRRYAATLTYGPQAGGDFIDFALSLPDGFSVNASVDTHADAAGNSVGAIHAELRLGGDDAGGFLMDGEVAGGDADAEFFPVKNPGNAIDLLHMNKKQIDQLIHDFKTIYGMVRNRFRRGQDY